MVVIIVVGAIVLMTLGYFFLMFFFPEWVGISGEDTAKTLAAHKETNPALMPPSDEEPKDI